MADNIQANGTFTVTINGNISKFIGDCSLNIPLTGSNAVSEVKNIAVSSLQPLSTGSLSDIRYMFFDNQGTGSIAVYVTNSMVAFLQPNDSTMIPWSGSIAQSPLYANATDSASLLYYIVREK